MTVGQTQFRFSRGNTREATVVVAASNSTALSKTKADYTCSGSDDQNPINTAIASLPSGGGSVLLMEGTYVIGGTIELPDNVEFCGLGVSTILQLAPTQADLLAIIENSDPTAGNEWISIRNLTIDGNRANQTPGDNHYGISMQNVSNILIEGCHMKSFSGQAIYFLTNVVGGAACDLITVTNNHFSDNVGSDIQFTTTDVYPAEQLKITHNTFEGAGTGLSCIWIIAAANSIISNNHINNSGNHGILVGDMGNGIVYSTISQNVFTEQVGGAGVFISNALHTIISGNVCRGNDTYGIRIGGTSSYNIIQGNIAYNNGQEGFALTLARSAIIGNIAYENSRDSDNTDDNILIAGNYNTVQGNVVHQSEDDKCRYGLRVNSGTDNVVTGNQCDHGGGNAGADDYSDNGTTTVNDNNNTR